MAVGLSLVILHGVLNPETNAFVLAAMMVYMVLLIILTSPSFLVSGWLWHLITRLDDARAVSS